MRRIGLTLAFGPLWGWIGLKWFSDPIQAKLIIPCSCPFKKGMGLDFTISRKMRFLRFFVKSILAVNPSGMRDMETGVPPLKPAGPGGFFCIINIDVEGM